MTPNASRATRNSKNELIQDIVGRLVRRHSTAAVLFHHAIADRLGLAPRITSASICCANAGRCRFTSLGE